jgi:hypothetical protein
MVIIACVFLMMLIVIVAIALDANDNSSTFLGLLEGIVFAYLLYITVNEVDQPIQPIDVYRGKTTLEITYRDSVAVDSVVVWKEE